MSAFFWIATIVMAVLAFSFVAPPLLKHKRRFGLLGVALGLPLFTAGMYWLVGTPEAASMAYPASFAKPGANSTSAEPGEPVGSVASMVNGLAARLQGNPDDGKGWLLLAQSYRHLKRLPEAKAAYEKALALGEDDATLAEFFGAELPADTGARIFGNVRLSERSKEIVLPTDTVFVFARAADGPPMPLAVLRRPVSDLPLDFLLNDSQSMSPGMKLSDFGEVVVTARISRSGIASESLQSLEAESGTIVVADNRHLDLVIE